MGQIKFIDRLPTDVRKEFNELVVSKSYKDCGFLTSWLKEKGYTTSKSAVHRYVSENRGKLVIAESTDSIILADVKLRALELSKSITPNADLDSIKESATDILEWIFKKQEE